VPATAGQSRPHLAEEPVQPVHFGPQDRLSFTGDRVGSATATPLIVPLGLADPLVACHAPENAIEVSRIEEHARLRALLHRPDEPVAVERSFGQDGQDEKVSGSKGEVHVLSVE
jgi:hypothetical protein